MQPEEFPHLKININLPNNEIASALSHCSRLNTVRLDADDILHPSFIPSVSAQTKNAEGVVTLGALALPMITLSRREDGGLNCMVDRRGHRKNAKHMYHFSLGQTVSLPYDLWLSKTPGQLAWGNHVHVEGTLRQTFKGSKVSSVDFKDDPGYYMITSLSGHFPFQHPPACDVDKLRVDGGVKELLKGGISSVPRLSAEEFNENLFVRKKEVPGRPGGTWWR